MEATEAITFDSVVQALRESGRVVHAPEKMSSVTCRCAVCGCATLEVMPNMGGPPRLATLCGCEPEFSLGDLTPAADRVP